ncbi:hypothetical protein BCR43DRAFT_492233 [Syncephalastrum racemosum]|uniref:Uncharacterized protein n=1 Tax=Syncephalastrum racemosum TaxID=13706 RepID=A0A1X2HD80_SYNRA|nr:hypothetical protein BCR43DRAFT_492233 [Syncephalastrum racemosum]
MYTAKTRKLAPFWMFSLGYKFWTSVLEDLLFRQKRYEAFAEFETKRNIPRTETNVIRCLYWSVILFTSLLCTLIHNFGDELRMT